MKPMFFLTFDNVQHLIKKWRLSKSTQTKALVAIATSVVQAFPDGLGHSRIQYNLNYSPMKWLHKFSLSVSNKYLVKSYDVDVLTSMMGVPTNEVELVLGYWDEHVKKEIAIVK